VKIKTHRRCAVRAVILLRHCSALRYDDKLHMKAAAAAESPSSTARSHGKTAVNTGAVRFGRRRCLHFVSQLRLIYEV